MFRLLVYLCSAFVVSCRVSGKSDVELRHDTDWTSCLTNRSITQPWFYRCKESFRHRDEGRYILTNRFACADTAQNAGIDVLPSIVNAALLTSAWSAGCADLYVSSRALYGLVSRGHAPQIFAKKRCSDGLPWVAVCFCAVFSLLSFLASAKGKAGTVFGYC